MSLWLLARFTGSSADCHLSTLPTAQISVTVGYTSHLNLAAVASGKLVQGSVQVGQRLLLGPTATATFKPVSVTSIERAQVTLMHLTGFQSSKLELACELRVVSRNWG